MFKNSQGMVNGYEVAGHADDIVCAAVSALTQAPTLALEQHLNCSVTHNVDVKNGQLRVRLNEANALTEAVFSVMKYGVSEIAKQYPKQVCVEW